MMNDMMNMRGGGHGLGNGTDRALVLLLLIPAIAALAKRHKRPILPRCTTLVSLNSMLGCSLRCGKEAHAAARLHQSSWWLGGSVAARGARRAGKRCI